MIFEKDISLKDCEKISSKVNSDFFRVVYSYKISIFLCGADINKKDTVRHKLNNAFSDWKYRIHYDLIYPEDIFDELLYSNNGKDLLSLETLLADSVDVIIIIPESAGSIAELGAFANNNKLNRKIVCLIDEKYKKDKSFIKQGPVRLIKEANKNGIIYINPSLVEKDIHEIHSAIRRVKKSNKKSSELTLLQLENFLLPTIFLLEPVKKQDLIDIVSFAIKTDPDTCFSATTTALAILIKKKIIQLSPNGYVLTESGKTKFLNLKTTTTRIKFSSQLKSLDNMRLEIMNYKYRKKKLKI